MKSNSSFFSVTFDLVLKDNALPYDLYINSAAKVNKERFIKIYPSGESLTKEEILEFKEKYHQLYVNEEQRAQYLQSLVTRDEFGKRDMSEDVKKTEAIKDSAIYYLDKIFDDEHEFTTNVLDEAIAGCRDSVESMVEIVQDYDILTLQEMIGKLSFHDFYTYDHSINVSMYNIAIFREVRPDASTEELVQAGLGGLLHDLGKIKIPTSIINNPNKLTDEEFAEIKKHPGYGKDLIQECSHQEDEDVDFSVIQRVVFEHHENYNGTGYPNQKAGEEIHLLARITAIADFFDALTTKRSYHEVMSSSEALELMSNSVGKKIDPELFEVFVKQVKDMEIAKSDKELPEDFDPCQPHNELPLQNVVSIESAKKKKVVKKKVVKKVVKKKSA